MATGPTRQRGAPDVMETEWVSRDLLPLASYLRVMYVAEEGREGVGKEQGLENRQDLNLIEGKGV